MSRRTKRVAVAAGLTLMALVAVPMAVVFWQRRRNRWW
jgi:hypothetical protein